VKWVKWVEWVEWAMAYRILQTRPNTATDRIAYYLQNYVLNHVHYHRKNCQCMCLQLKKHISKNQKKRENVHCRMVM